MPKNLARRSSEYVYYESRNTLTSLSSRSLRWLELGSIDTHHLAADDAADVPADDALGGKGHKPRAPALGAAVWLVATVAETAAAATSGTWEDEGQDTPALLRANVVTLWWDAVGVDLDDIVKGAALGRWGLNDNFVVELSHT